MKNITGLWFIAFLAFLLVLSCKSNRDTDSISFQSVNEFKAAISKNDAPIVDVRTPKEYEKEHINGARNIDWKNSTFKESIAQLNKEEPVYIYCRSGKRSGAAAAAMEQMGFKKIYNLETGILGWMAEELPVKNAGTIE